MRLASSCTCFGRSSRYLVHPFHPPQVGKELSGALCATLFGMLLANVGVLPAAGAPELSIVYKFILPLAIPMLLFSADLM